MPGIIPARAGFTRVRPPGPCGMQDHPRSRGVYSSSGTAANRRLGSSPLARGLPIPTRPHGPVPGIIPARAGFTPRGPGGDPRRPDHPRSRGVYPRAHVDRSRPSGSSPLARGLHRGKVIGAYTMRIIPARAGFTSHNDWTPPKGPDHPRSRGVYLRSFSTRLSPWGSSPLARGLHLERLTAHERPRIIPARAGFTRCSAPRTPAPMDHPRSRGVYLGDHVPGRHPEGSSPLARGLH